jgi:hypothetical protein
MLITRWMWVAVSFAFVVPLAHANDPVEPNAGTWKTWVISSGRDFRVPPPPGSAVTQAEFLAYLFPSRADFIRAVGKEAGDSRIWAGIHFPMDNAAGVELGGRWPRSSYRGHRAMALIKRAEERQRANASTP